MTIGGKVEAIALDVAVYDAAAHAAAEVERRFGRLDVLVNNAAIHYDPSARALRPDWTVIREAFEINVFGAWRVAAAFAPLLTASGHGRLVNVSSEGGSLASMGAGAPAYSTSKATLNALTRILAAELRGSGVLVNSICPGWVATDMGGPGGRPVAQGAAGIVWAATLPDDGPTGGFFAMANGCRGEAGAPKRLPAALRMLAPRRYRCPDRKAFRRIRNRARLVVAPQAPAGHATKIAFSGREM
ncbi:SDR family NAD(P)-dependent oxidoreductase [Mesorhizobium atlanticum]